MNKSFSNVHLIRHITFNLTLDKMPVGLREAHHQLDLAVERCYRTKPFETDEERLEYLFKLYEQMIAEEKAKNGELVFDIPKVKKAKTKVK